MKPQLVDYGNVFKKDELFGIKTVEKINKKTTIKQIGNFNFFFNLIGIIILILGGIILYYRKENKETNKKIYNQKVIQFYHDIN
tara:strand:- start:2139 stop:2390 length:252 start_codon:yes stop_codon:yes gene_type:complete